MYVEINKPTDQSLLEKNSVFIKFGQIHAHKMGLEFRIIISNSQSQRLLSGLEYNLEMVFNNLPRML